MQYTCPDSWALCKPSIEILTIISKYLGGEGSICQGQYIPKLGCF